MRIGIDGRDLFDNEITGIARYLLLFLTYVQKHPREHTYILFLNQYNRCSLDDTIQRRILTEKNIRVYDQLKLPYFVYREKIDLFFSPYPKMPILSGCKKVITIHDLTPICLDIYREGLTTNAQYISHYIYARCANAIITDSEYSKNDIVKILKIPERRVHVIYDAVEEHFWKRHKPDNIRKVRSKYKVPEKYIFYVANMNPHKNLKTLIKAYFQLSKSLKKKFSLVIAGSKSGQYPELFKLVQDLELSKNVLFPGFIDDKDLPALYQGATLFVFPSLYEGFGLPPLEAMTSGIPVIASNATSLPEVINDAGILVNPKDIKAFTNAITIVLSNPGIQNELSLRGLKRAKKFCQSKTAQNILTLFESL